MESDLAYGYNSKPELIPAAYYSEGKYDKLRDTAVSCYKLLDELHVASLKGTAGYSSQAGWVFGGLGALFFLNAWAFRGFFRANAQSRSNL